MKNITICICTYDNYDVLYKSINSLVKQSVTQSEYDVLILDNTTEELFQKSKSLVVKIISLCNKCDFRYVEKSQVDYQEQEMLALN